LGTLSVDLHRLNLKFLWGVGVDRQPISAIDDSRYSLTPETAVEQSNHFLIDSRKRKESKMAREGISYLTFQNTFTKE
jgi:hypothetical protein